MTSPRHAPLAALAAGCALALLACAEDPPQVPPADGEMGAPDPTLDMAHAPDQGDPADASDLPAGGPDGGGPVGEDMDADMASGPGPPRCESDEGFVRCPHESRLMLTGVTGVEPRTVHWQLPTGPPPSGGWPVVFFFQGAGSSALLIWDGEPGDPFGGYHRARTVEALLEAGFAVIAPETPAGGTTYWTTNVWPWNYSWETSSDHQLMQRLFELLEGEEFGPLDRQRLYAVGLSSGGYMTSRMAVSYPGQFRALAIHSGSYATCAGVTCLVPDDLPADHPPTLFLHGEEDGIVPLWTMEDYAEELAEQQIPHERVVDPEAGHEWIPAAPEAVRRWFQTH